MNEEDLKTLEEYEVGLEPGEEYEVDLEPGEDSEDEPEAAMGYTTDYAKAKKTYIMYHGTTMENAMKIKKRGFIQSPDGMLGRGVYVSRNIEKARRYPLNAGGKQLAVLKLNVRIGKVKKIDSQGHPMRKTWHSYGFSTAWVPPNCGMTPSGLEEDCVYSPWRIKVLDIKENKR